MLLSKYLSMAPDVRSSETKRAVVAATIALTLLAIAVFSRVDWSMARGQAKAALSAASRTRVAFFAGEADAPAARLEQYRKDLATLYNCRAAFPSNPLYGRLAASFSRRNAPAVEALSKDLARAIDQNMHPFWGDLAETEKPRIATSAATSQRRKLMRRSIR